MQRSIRGQPKCFVHRADRYVDDAYTSSSVESLYSRFPTQACRTFFGAGGKRRACGVIERAWLNYAMIFLEGSITGEHAESKNVSYITTTIPFLGSDRLQGILEH